MVEKHFQEYGQTNTYIKAKANMHNTNTNITMETPTNTNNHVLIDITSIHTIPAYTNVYKYTYHRVYIYIMQICERIHVLISTFHILIYRY